MADKTAEQKKYETTEKRNAQETISERRAREEAEQAARAAASALGGMSGKAGEALMSRKSKIDQALKDAGG